LEGEQVVHKTEQPEWVRFICGVLRKIEEEKGDNY